MLSSFRPLSVLTSSAEVPLPRLSYLLFELRRTSTRFGFLSPTLGCCDALAFDSLPLYALTAVFNVPLVNLSARRQVCNSFFQTHF